MSFSNIQISTASSYQFFSLPPEKPRGALTKIRDLSKDLTKGLRKDLSASSSTIVKPRNSNNLFGDRKPMSSLNGGSHPSINSSTRWDNKSLPPANAFLKENRKQLNGEVAVPTGLPLYFFLCISWNNQYGSDTSYCYRSLNRGATTGTGSSTSRTGGGADETRRGGRPNSVRSSESISSLRSPAR